MWFYLKIIGPEGGHRPISTPYPPWDFCTGNRRWRGSFDDHYPSTRSYLERDRAIYVKESPKSTVYMLRSHFGSTPPRMNATANPLNGKNTPSHSPSFLHGPSLPPQRAYPEPVISRPLRNQRGTNDTLADAKGHRRPPSKA